MNKPQAPQGAVQKLFHCDSDALQEAYMLSRNTGQAIHRHLVFNKFGNARWLISEIADPVTAEIEFYLHEELTHS